MFAPHIMMAPVLVKSVGFLKQIANLWNCNETVLICFLTIRISVKLVILICLLCLKKKELKKILGCFHIIIFFQLSARSEREFRALEVCEMMSDEHTLQLAIKYSSRMRFIQLAQRISEMAVRKAEEREEKATERYWTWTCCFSAHLKWMKLRWGISYWWRQIG